MNSILLPYTHQCFVCGVNNPHGLQLKFHAEDGEIRARFQPKVQHEGYRGVVHGGIVASALDEVMFWAAAYAARRFYVSVEIGVRYLRKVEVGREYLLVGRVTRDQRRVCFTEAELRESGGDVCASATGKFFPMRAGDVPLSHEDFYPDPQAFSSAELFSNG
jgi:uncharacterized protein (TIGR00369 family)